MEYIMVMFLIIMFGLVTAWIVFRAIIEHEGQDSQTCLKHDSAIMYPIITWRKRLTPPCYQCKHCVYKEDEYIRYSNKKLQPYCDKKSAVNYYERFANEHSSVVNSDYIRGTKYCEFKRNKDLD